jgi:hypothetical protein
MVKESIQQVNTRFKASLMFKSLFLGGVFLNIAISYQNYFSKIKFKFGSST